MVDPRRVSVLRRDLALGNSCGPAGIYPALPSGVRADCTSVVWLADSMAGLEGAERCQISLWSHQITVDCGSGGSQMPSRTVDRLERILERRKFADPREASVASGGVPPVTYGQETIATGWTRNVRGAARRRLHHDSGRPGRAGYPDCPVPAGDELLPGPLVAEYERTTAPDGVLRADPPGMGRPRRIERFRRAS